MPKRVVKRYRFEAETERIPLKPAVERRLRKIAAKSAPGKIQEWRASVEEKNRFYAAPKAALAAFMLSDHLLARQLAEEALQLAPSYSENWNFGNAVHFAHTTLGLLKLEGGDVQGAEDHLWRSADIPGSAQLNSFGPSMWLARELLRRGRSESVLSYFEQCRVFWKSGQVWLNIWRKKVQRGAMPTFFMQLYR